MYEPSFQDYESSYEYGDLDEMYDESYASSLEDLDEDMYRDHESYETLAYRHYAWYNSSRHARGLMNTHVKKHLQVVLDLSVYDDLNIEDIDWASMLQLEGDESVDVNIKDFYEVY